MSSIIDTIKQVIIIFLPIFSIFIVGYYYPPSTIDYTPVFQPPSPVFSIVWTYVTLALGLITNYALKRVDNKGSILLFYSILIVALNGWLILNDNKDYKLGFYVLLFTCFMSILYQTFLGFHQIKPSVLLLPLSFWLVIATALNGTIYDHASPLK